ncbi:RING-type domain-containing protein [Psidium guajava]|nr:RING-type domain-containing protein [Psidium guajava]
MGFSWGEADSVLFLPNGRIRMRRKLTSAKSVENTHEKSVWTIAWIPTMKAWPAFLLTGSLNEIVKFWRPDELAFWRINADHFLGVVSMAVHPPNVIAASGSIDSLIRVLDVDTNVVSVTFEASP